MCKKCEYHMRELLQIFISFFKIGALTFGGGYSMLPMIQRELAEKRAWVNNEEIIDYYAIAQCLPGIIAVNTATLCGRKIKGLPGGAAAALGVICPSFIIIVVIAAFIQNFVEYAVVQNAFFGIRIAVAALILDSIIKLWKLGVKDKTTFAIFFGVFALSLIWKISPVYLVLIAIASGVLTSKRDFGKKGGAN